MALRSFFNQPRLVFLLLVLLLAANHFGCYAGHFGYDDMEYARLAKLAADGRFQLTGDHFSYRWFIIFGTGLFYRLFGVNDHSSALLPFLATVATLRLVLFLTRYQLPATRSAALLFCGLSPLTLFYADKLMPDVYVALFVTGAFAAYHHARFGTTGRKSLAGAAFSAAFLLGFLAKESILLLAPAFGYLFITDLFRKRNAWFWRQAVLSLLLLAGAYFLLVYYTTGSPWSRWTAIQANNYLNPCSYDRLPRDALFRRLTVEMPLGLMRSGIFLPLMLALPLLVRYARRLPLTEDEPAFFGVMAFSALACGWLMTTSLKAYVPLCPDMRHYLFLVPLAAPAAAAGLQVVRQRSALGWAPVLLSALCFCLSWQSRFELTFYAALPLLLFCLLLATGRVFNGRPGLLMALLFVLLLLPGVQAGLYTRRLNNDTQKQVLLRFFRHSRQPATVVTNEVQRNLGYYYLGFDSSRCRFLSYQQVVDGGLPADRPVFLLNNWYTSYLSSADPEKIPPFVRSVPPDFQKLYDSNGVQLYRAAGLPARP